MKKSIAVFIAVLLWGWLPAASAAPVSLSGDTTLKYESAAVADASVESATRFSIRLLAEKKLTETWSLYARLGAQYTTNPLFTDFNTAAYAADAKAATAIDQFGAVYKAESFSAKLGRQTAMIGSTLLLYNRDDANIGKDAFVEGIKLEAAAGRFDLSGIYARENNLWTANNDLFAVRAAYNFSKHANLGLLYGQYRYLDGNTTRHWAVDGTVKSGKHTFTAEYTQSDASDQNKAYALVWNYAFDDKTSLCIKNFRVETNGDMGKQSDFDNNHQGFHYGLTRAFNKTLSLELVYKSQTELLSTTKNNVFEATLTQTF